MQDIVERPAHYCSHQSGVEPVDISEALGFHLGCAFHYVWRSGLKTPDSIPDLQKALRHLSMASRNPIPNSPSHMPRAAAFLDRALEAERDERLRTALNAIFIAADSWPQGKAIETAASAVSALLMARRGLAA